MRIYIGRVAVVMLVAALPSCGPSSNRLAGIPSAPTGLTLLSLTISGPSTMPPGSTAQFRAAAKYSDGSSKDVTSAVTWRSSDTSILTITDAGLATARQTGDVNIAAALNSAWTVAEAITVVPPGTFSLTGRVSWAGRQLEGAAVEVTAGIGAGLATVTDLTGAYHLYGVAGLIELSVSEPLYTTIRQSVLINSNATLNFQMQPAGPLPQFTGGFTLQITADAACANNAPQPLPDSGRVRRYAATFEPYTAGLAARLSGADFLPNRNAIYGYITPDGARMDVNHLDYYYGYGYPPPDVGEILPNGDVYCPSGSITLTAIGADFVGTLDGTLRIRRPPSGEIVGECTSTQHRIAFTKQSDSTAHIGPRR